MLFAKSSTSRFSHETSCGGYSKPAPGPVTASTDPAPLMLGHSCKQCLERKSEGNNNYRLAYFEDASVKTKQRIEVKVRLPAPPISTEAVRCQPPVSIRKSEPEVLVIDLTKDRFRDLSTRSSVDSRGI